MSYGHIPHIHHIGGAVDIARHLVFRDHNNLSATRWFAIKGAEKGRWIQHDRRHPIPGGLEHGFFHRDFGRKVGIIGKGCAEGTGFIGQLA